MANLLGERRKEEVKVEKKKQKKEKTERRILGLDGKIHEG
jgi:hypothetical protein